MKKMILFTVYLTFILNCVHAEWRSIEQIRSDLFAKGEDPDKFDVNASLLNLSAEGEFGISPSPKTAGIHIQGMCRGKKGTIDWSSCDLRHSNNTLDYKIWKANPAFEDVGVVLILLDSDKFEICRIRIGKFCKGCEIEQTGKYQMNYKDFEKIKFYKIIFTET
jgi:hypothetical protein